MFDIQYSLVLVSPNHFLLYVLSDTFSLSVCID